MNSKVKRIFSNVSEEIDAILILNDVEPNIDSTFFYVTGLDSGIFEGSCLILWPDGSTELISSKLEEGSARSAFQNFKIFEKTAERNKMIEESLRGINRIGLNFSSLTVKNYKEINKLLDEAEKVDVSSAIEKTRLVKELDEIEKIRKACRIVSAVADEIPNFLTEGITEYEAAAEISYRMQKMGATSPSFDPIISFGSNSAEPHHLSSDNKLSIGHCTLFDFGAKYKRYCSDITRTYFFGRPLFEFEEMYEIVLEAQQSAIDMMRAGIMARDVDARARKIIDSTCYKGKFVHSLGHSIGLAVHDGGRISQDNDLVLEENMVFTIEPGIYVSGKGGIRIEDNVRVTKDGCEILTTARRELLVI